MNTSKASIKFSEIPVSSHFGNYGSLGGTLISNRHSGPPAQTDPLANVVGQTSPQGFDPNLNQATQTKLPQPKLLLNPRIGEFVVGPKGIPEAISKKLGETFKKVTRG